MKENGNRGAERKFNVSEKIVRDWRKKEDELRSTKKTKGYRSGKDVITVSAEERLIRRSDLYAGATYLLNFPKFSGFPPLATYTQERLIGREIR